MKGILVVKGLSAHENNLEFVEISEYKIVKQNLWKAYDYWQNILKENVAILNVINEGYKIILLDIPKPSAFKNNNSATDHSTFVAEAVFELLQSERIQELQALLHITNPLPVTIQNSWKKRLMLHLRHENEFLYKDETKLDNIKLME